jgi:DNA-binding MarR family transcriptional regulator
VNSPEPGERHREAREEPDAAVEPEKPEDGEPTLAELVTALAGRLRAAWRDGLAPYGLSPHQGRALLVVALNPGLRPTDLATRLRIAPRSATEVVDGLVAAGLLDRRPDPQDRRAVLLSLTDEGHRQVRAIRVSREEAAETLFDTIPPRDRQQLRRILSALLREGDAPRTG